MLDSVRVALAGRKATRVFMSRNGDNDVDDTVWIAKVSVVLPAVLSNKVETNCLLMTDSADMVIDSKNV